MYFMVLYRAIENLKNPIIQLVLSVSINCVYHLALDEVFNKELNKECSVLVV